MKIETMFECKVRYPVLCTQPYKILAEKPGAASILWVGKSQLSQTHTSRSSLSPVLVTGLACVVSKVLIASTIFQPPSDIAVASSN